MDEQRGERVVLLGRPALTTWDAVAQALAVGPIASIGLGGFLLARTAGGAALFVVSIALLGALCLGWVVSRYARAYAGAGSVYEYISCALGKPVGVACAGFEFFVGPVGIGSLYVLVGVLWRGFALAHLGFDPGWWSGGVLVAGAVFAMQYRGIRLAARSQLLLTALAAVPFVVLFAAVVIRGGASGNTLAVFLPGRAQGTEVFRSLLFAVSLFAGFEASAAIGEEVHRPHRSIPAAMLATIGAAGVFYLLVGYAATIGFGTENVAKEWGANPAGLSALADRYVGPPLGALTELAVLLDLVAVIAAYGNEIGRGFFALARDRLLPGRLAARSRHDTPLGGLVVATGGGIVVLLSTVGVKDQLTVVEALAVTVTLANMVVYLVLAVGAPRMLPGRPAGWLVTAAAVALPAFGLYGTLVPFPVGAGRVGVGGFAALLVVTAAWVVLLRFRRPGRLERAAGYTLRAGPPAAR